MRRNADNPRSEFCDRGSSARWSKIRYGREKEVVRFESGSRVLAKARISYDFGRLIENCYNSGRLVECGSLAFARQKNAFRDRSNRLCLQKPALQLGVQPASRIPFRHQFDNYVSCPLLSVQLISCPALLHQGIIHYVVDRANLFCGTRVFFIGIHRVLPAFTLTIICQLTTSTSRVVRRACSLPGYSIM